MPSPNYELFPAPATWDDDVLCDVDLGNNDGFADAWVARLRGSAIQPVSIDVFHGYGTSSYTFDNGFIYVAFVYPLTTPYVHLAKFFPNGTVAWVKKYNNMYISNFSDQISNVIKMTADEARGVLYLGKYGREDYDQRVDSVTSIVTDDRAEVYAINAINGAFMWTNSAMAGYRLNNCLSQRMTPVVSGQIRYDSYYDNVSFQFSTQGSPTTGNMVIEWRANGGTYQRASRIGLPGTGQSAYIMDAGNLGTQRSTVTYRRPESLSQAVCYVYPGPSPYPTNQASMETSLGVLVAKFLGNGQLLIWFTNNEIMLIGANNTIVDHVKFPDPVSTESNPAYYETIGRPGLEWPEAAGTASQGSHRASPQVWYGVNFIPAHSAIYLQSPSPNGTAISKLGVNIGSNNLITSITSLTLRIEASSKTIGAGAWAGSNKIAPNSSSNNRVTLALGGGAGSFWAYEVREVAVSSIKRTGATQTLGDYSYSVGSTVSANVGPNATFRVVEPDVAASRSGLTATYLPSTYTGLRTYWSIATPGTGFCDESLGLDEDAAIIFKSSAQISLGTETEDVTSTVIFDTYYSE
jgi:hypothetical protein